MANEPERPIEKLLRAAAKKRRDEAGAAFELHPADRRVLQDEVARQFARPLRATRSFSELLGQLWPRFAWGVGLLAVLGVSVWVLKLPTGHEKEEARLAQNQSMSEAAPAQARRLGSPRPPVAAAPPVASAAKMKSAQFASSERAEPAIAAPARERQVESQLLANDRAAGSAASRDEEKFALAAAPQPADQRASPRMQVAASSKPSAQGLAEAANGALESRYGYFPKPATAASAPAAPAAAPAVTAAPETANLLALEESAKKKADESGSAVAAYRSLTQVASANRPGAARFAADSLSAAAPETLEEAKGAVVAQRFVQVAPRAGLKAAFADQATSGHPVLASFQVEQAGQELRILDGDGSVYRGYLQLASAARQTRPVKAEAPGAARASRAPAEAFEGKDTLGLDLDHVAPQSYSFRVAGTNRSLNKKVVFTGNLVAATNFTLSLPVRKDAGVAGRLGGSQDAPGRTLLLPLSNSRISGKVVVGSGKPVELNALPAKP
jgi:hypothetical protein